MTTLALEPDRISGAPVSAGVPAIESVALSIRSAHFRLGGVVPSISLAYSRPIGSEERCRILRETAEIAHARLTAVERAELMIVAAEATDPADRRAVALSILEDASAGWPVPAFLDIADDARTWASWASRPELRSYLTACWGRLSSADRRAFMKSANTEHLA